MSAIFAVVSSRRVHMTTRASVQKLDANADTDTDAVADAFAATRLEDSSSNMSGPIRFSTPLLQRPPRTRHANDCPRSTFDAVAEPPLEHLASAKQPPEHEDSGFLPTTPPHNSSSASSSSSTSTPSSCSTVRRSAGALRFDADVRVDVGGRQETSGTRTCVSLRPPETAEVRRPAALPHEWEWHKFQSALADWARRNVKRNSLSPSQRLVALEDGISFCVVIVYRYRYRRTSVFACSIRSPRPGYPQISTRSASESFAQ